MPWKLMKVLSPVTTSESLWAFAVQKWQASVEHISLSPLLWSCQAMGCPLGTHLSHTEFFIYLCARLWSSSWAFYAFLNDSYSVILCIRANLLRSSRMRLWMVTVALHSAFWSKRLRRGCSVVTWLVLCETAAVSVHVLCSLYNHAPD